MTGKIFIGYVTPMVFLFALILKYILKLLFKSLFLFHQIGTKKMPD